MQYRSRRNCVVCGWDTDGSKFFEPVCYTCQRWYEAVRNWFNALRYIRGHTTTSVTPEGKK